MFIHQNNDKHFRFLTVLAEEAQHLDIVARVRILAGIVWKGNFVSIESNSNKSHPFHTKFAGYNDEQIYPHAETNAIRKALNIITPTELSKSTLYIARIKKGEGDTQYPTGYKWAMAKPCEGCMGAISSFDITKVYYTVMGNLYDDISGCIQ